MYNKDLNNIKSLYLKDKLTCKQISKLYNCTDEVIRRRLYLMKIKRREQPRFKKGKLNPSYKDGRKLGDKENRREYLKIAKESFKWICHHCGQNNTKFDLIIHHINNINRDNRLINLLILCQSCHCKQHYNSSTKLFNSTGCGTPT